MTTTAKWVISGQVKFFIQKNFFIFSPSSLTMISLLAASTQMARILTHKTARMIFSHVCPVIKLSPKSKDKSTIVTLKGIRNALLIL
jgi:hypothetical protein